MVGVVVVDARIVRINLKGCLILSTRSFVVVQNVSIHIAEVAVRRYVLAVQRNRRLVALCV